MRTGTFLPEVAAQEGWDRAQTLDALIRKAGYPGRPTDAIRESLTITRYQVGDTLPSCSDAAASCLLWTSFHMFLLQYWRHSLRVSFRACQF